MNIFLKSQDSPKGKEDTSASHCELNVTRGTIVTVPLLLNSTSGLSIGTYFSALLKVKEHLSFVLMQFLFSNLRIQQPNAWSPDFLSRIGAQSSIELTFIEL